MHVELLYWNGCPSHPRALAELRAAMADLGLDPDTIAVREIHAQAEATRERFVGSPTIRIDGADIQPPPVREPYGLTCRVYHRRDDRISPIPDPADVRDALAAAAAAHAGAARTARDAGAAHAGARPDDSTMTDRSHI